MPLIIEDGSIVEGANSYVTGVEYLDWSDARFGNNRTARPSQSSDADRLVLRATDYFETLHFIGEKVSSAQSLQWPRTGAVIDGFEYPSNQIPPEVKSSIFELAYAHETGIGLMQERERKVKKEKADVVEVEYFESSAAQAYSRAVSVTLQKLLANAYGINNFAVCRS